VYLSHFGLTERPFNVTPDPRFFFATAGSQEAWATVRYGVTARKGFVVLTGEVGTGKTTLLRRLLTDLDPGVATVFLHNTALDFDDLLTMLCDELELEPESDTRLGRVGALNRTLIAQLARGGTTAVLVDEAQNLSTETLESLRLLSNLETDREKLLQLVLCGQPELDAALDRPVLRQLKQRIAVRVRLDRLRDSEVGPFIAHRLAVAGCRRRVFTRDAIATVTRCSDGVPRLINHLCDATLLLAYADGRDIVSSDNVREAARDLGLAHGADAAAPVGPAAVAAASRSRSWRLGPISLAGGAVAIAAAGVLVLMHADGAPTLARLTTTLTAHGRQMLFALAAAMPRVPLAASSAPVMPVPPSSETPSSAPAPWMPVAGTSDTEAAEARALPDPQRVVDIPRGSTVGAIVAGYYASDPLLGFALLKDANPGLDNVDRVIAGERLIVPPTTLAGRRQQAPDGTSIVLIASFAGAADAARLARTMRGAGYETVVRPIALRPGHHLHGVEITGLRTTAETERAWAEARAQGWTRE